MQPGCIDQDQLVIVGRDNPADDASGGLGFGGGNGDFGANHGVGQSRFSSIWSSDQADEARTIVLRIVGWLHDVVSSDGVWVATRMVSTRLRLPASESTVSVRFSISVTEPSVGILPKLLANNPPTVSTSSSSSSNRLNVSQKAVTDIATMKKNSPSGCEMKF